jgi:glycosyltransferase involved in cell wall biosynthesis
MTLPTYSVISPVRDEAEFLDVTAASIVNQTHRPQRWVIVDDGSTDDTASIAREWAAEHQWIKVISSESRHGRSRGAPIVAAFKRGLFELEERPEVVVKLDGDLFLPAHYFEWVASVFERDSRAGVVGGTVWMPERGRWRLDYGKTSHNVHGVAKAYRYACLDDIGGLQESMGWDGIDEYAARARDWHVHALGELNILHYKPRGSKQQPLRSRWQEGRGNAFMGYRWQFMLLRAAYRGIVERPPVLGGLALFAAYVDARLRRLAQVPDPDAIAELRREQAQRMRSLLRLRQDVEPATVLPDGGPAFWFRDQAATRRSAGRSPAGDSSDMAH